MALVLNLVVLAPAFVLLGLSALAAWQDTASMEFEEPACFALTDSQTQLTPRRGPLARLATSPVRLAAQAALYLQAIAPDAGTATRSTLRAQLAKFVLKAKVFRDLRIQQNQRPAQ